MKHHKHSVQHALAKIKKHHRKHARRNPTTGEWIGLGVGLAAVASVAGYMIYKNKQATAPTAFSGASFQLAQATQVVVGHDTTIPLGGSILLMPAGPALFDSPGPTTSDATVVTPATGPGAIIQGVGSPFVAIRAGTATLNASVGGQASTTKITVQ